MRILRFFFTVIAIVVIQPVKGQYYRNPAVLFAKGAGNSEGDLIWTIGDSQMDGRGLTVPTIASGIMDIWNGSTWTAVTTQSICNDGSDGSMQQYFATVYKTNTGKKVFLVNSAKGGSGLYNQGGGIKHWSGGGGADDLWVPALANVQAALTSKGLSQPKAIIVSLGHVDARDAVSYANMTSATSALISNIITAFPSTPILWLATGRLTTTAMNVDLYSMRRAQINAAEANTNLHIVGNACAISLYPSAMLVDNLHMNNAGLEQWANQVNRWFTNSSISNKWSRSVISSMFDDLNTVRKTEINAVISGLYSRGDLFELEHLSIFKQTLEYNANVDWTFLGFSFGTGSTFTANTSISTNGSSTFHSYTFFSDINIRAATATDFIEGVKIKTKSTANGVAAVAFGASISGTVRAVGQSTTNSAFRENDNTLTSGGESGITADHVYAGYRNGTTKGLKKDKTNQASATQASTGTVNQFPRIGAQNSNGTTGTYMGGTWEYVFAARFTTFDYDSFYDDIEHLCAHWND